MRKTLNTIRTQLRDQGFNVRLWHNDILTGITYQFRVEPVTFPGGGRVSYFHTLPQLQKYADDVQAVAWWRAAKVKAAGVPAGKSIPRGTTLSAVEQSLQEVADAINAQAERAADRRTWKAEPMQPQETARKPLRTIFGLQQIARDAAKIGQLQDRVKQRSRTYQAELKAQVAESLGVPFEKLDLPYHDWARIRDSWLSADKSLVKNLFPIA